MFIISNFFCAIMRRTLSCAFAIFLAACFALPVHAQTAISQDMNDYAGIFPGLYVGWGITTPRGTWNNIQVVLYAHDGSGSALHSTSNLYLLSKPYIGAPQGLTSSVAGYIATSTGQNAAGYWQFDASVTLQPNTVYYLFMDSSGGGLPGSLGDDNASSQTLYATLNKSVAYSIGSGYPVHKVLGIEIYTPPTLSQAFGASNITYGDSTPLTFTITNPNAGTGLSGVAFTDTLPPGLTISTPNGLTGSCGAGATISATAGSTSISLSGGTLGASGSCSFSVNVTSGSTGTMNNTTSTVQSLEAGDGGASSASLTVAKADQTIAFGPFAATTYGGAAFTVNATATSGLTAFTFASTSPTVCTVSGSQVTIVGAGACQLTADQAGDANYNAAPQAATTVTVNKANQTITFGPFAAQTFGAPAFSVSATSTSGLTAFTFASTSPTVCSVAGNMVTIVTAGSCHLTADQPGDANYNAASQAQQTIVIAQQSTILTLAAPNSSVIGTPVTITATVTGNSPTGTVTFCDGAATSGPSCPGATLCTVQLVPGTASSVAVCTATFSTVGDHTLSAYYAGDTNSFATATAQVVTALVVPQSVPAPLLDRWALLLLSVLFVTMRGCVDYWRQRGR